MNASYSSEEAVILHVDPVRRCRQSVEELLSDMPYAFRAVGTLDEAFKVGEKREVVCLISEMSFPDGMVHDLIIGLRSRFPDLPVILLSGSLTRQSLLTVQSFDIFARIRKPAMSKEIRQSVLRALQNVRGGRKSEKKAHEAVVLVMQPTGHVRYQITMSISEMGYHVLETQSVEETLRHLQDKIVDILITDLEIPGEDSLELIRSVNSHLSAPPILAVTWARNAAVIRAAVSAGIKEILTKPPEKGRLQKTVAALVQKARQDRERTEVSNEVLILDAEKGLQHAIGRLAQKRGLYCLPAESRSMALEILRQNSLAAAILPADEPDIDIHAFIKEIHSECPGLPLILTYRTLAADDLDRILNAGIAELLEKPFDTKVLVDDLVSLVRKGRGDSDLPERPES